MRVLVTGGAGYVGSHCCKAIHDAGHEPVVYDNLSTGHASLVRWGPLIEGDIRDADRLQDAFATVKPAAVMHFAAQSLVGHSVCQPGETYRTNLCGTMALLEAMCLNDVTVIVFSSTCAIYGVPETLPITEDTPQRPISPYGASKAMVEQVMHDYETAFGIRSVALRYFNAAGASGDAPIGEWHEPETHLVPNVLDAALGLKPALRINGRDYDTPDGTAVRDYIHVDDLADAHVSALDALLAGGPSRRLNLGTGRGVSICRMIETVRAVTGRDVPVEYGPRREGDPPVLVADPGLAHAVLGWRASRSLEDIVASAWAWHVRLRRGEAPVPAPARSLVPA